MSGGIGGRRYWGKAVLEGAVLGGTTELTIQSVPVGPLLLCVVSRGVVM